MAVIRHWAYRLLTIRNATHRYSQRNGAATPIAGAEPGDLERIPARVHNSVSLGGYFARLL